MRAFVSGKNPPVVRRAMQSLIVPFQEHWGEPGEFVKAAGEILAREASDMLTSVEEAEAAAQRALAQTNMIRSTYMRAVESTANLDTVNKALERTFSTSPFALGCLWLAYRSHTSAIAFIGSAEGQQAISSILKDIDAAKNKLVAAVEGIENPSLDVMEILVFRFSKRKLARMGHTDFQSGAVAAHMIERTRRASRTPAQFDMIPADMTDIREEVPMVAVLSEPVRAAELQDARNRFARLKNTERAKRYDAFRKSLVRKITSASKFAVDGFDKLCVAIENEMFPYPTNLEWIRSFLKPVFTNAAQSSVFDNCVTEQSVEARYQKLQEEKSVNIVMLELGKAMAMSNFKAAKAESIKNFVAELNLVKEFQWPASVDELKTIMASK